MCGIFFYLGTQYNVKDLINAFMESSHRGPDSSILKSISNNCIIGFHRLSIMDLSPSGDQPFYSNNKVLVCNGEIYNHSYLRGNYDINLPSGSDCSVLLPLYEKLGVKEMVQHLDGDFASIIVDNDNGLVHLLRDPVGVKPLFYGFSKDREFFAASEMKSISPFVEQCIMVTSGTYLTYDMNHKSLKTTYYWNPESFSSDQSQLSYKLENAVRKRLMSDQPIGLFISGGLDSSLIAAIASREIGGNIHSFAIGMEGSQDLVAATKVAEFLQIINHHNITFTIEEGLQAIPEVIKQLETFDITTIRASVPQYLLSKFISENTDVKVVLSGEGSDELFGGYLYFHNTPSNEAFKEESDKLIRELQYFDVLRTDRTTAAWGLEVRVPFLDRGFIKFVRNLPEKYKNPNCSNGESSTIEKKILRDSFKGYLPNDILYKKKDAFSDSCGKQWIPSVQEWCNYQVSDEEFARSEEIFPHVSPKSKEAFYYRKIFEKYYPGQSHILPHYWLPNWCETNDEPSAKLLKLI